MSILVSVPKYPSCNHHGPDLRKVRLSFNGKVRVPLRSRSTTIVSRVVSNNGIRNIITTLPIQLDEAVEKGDGSPAASVPPAVSAPGEVLSVTPSTTPGRSSFPPGFTFGAATAAYQIEGAWDTDGKGPSIWDTFTHNHPGKIAGWRDGDNGIESYTRFKEDVKALKDMGLDAYRFSISWPRILPKGSKNGGLNRDGIQYYNNLINELKENGIKPYVTLFHWDTPQALEDEYGGFRSYKIVNDFKDFVDVCFEEFGDRVRNWITLNEPFIFSSFGYGKGTHAPGRCSSRKECEEGDSLREPYIVAHNLIRAHTAAARLYKEKYQANQKGQIGITLNVHWYKPISDSYQDIEAASRAVQFMLGWFLDPLVYGDYPFCMKALVRDRLPSFTPQESELIKDSYDFIGINYYTARYAQGKQFQGQPTTNADDSYVTESRVDGDGKPIGEQSGAWINLCAEELKELLVYLKCRYNNPKIYITENGTCEVEKGDHLMLTLGSELDDPHRSKYMYLHLDKLREAIEQEGVNVHGYFAWSLLDNFEWSSGYTQRFGLTYVDHHTFQRIPKESATWFTKFLRA